MDRLKAYWEIEKQQQLLWPFIGMILIGYLGFKFGVFISEKLTIEFTSLVPYQHILIVGFAIGISVFLLKGILQFLKRVEKRWKVTFKWELIVILIVFSITGSTSVMVGRPLLKVLGLTTDNLPVFLYWPLFVMCSFIFYQIFLVFYGWLFGQHAFFWEMERKMLTRFRLIKSNE